MIIIIRGHIRNSFETKDLYNLIKEIYNLFPDLKIFIHTWNIFANNISWREIVVNNQPVNHDIIYDYFDDLHHIIEHIIIDDDTKIQLIGNLDGNINNGQTPIIGWKNYWYGKYKIIDFIYNKSTIDKNEMVINCRFDIFCNHSTANNITTFNQPNIINFLKNNSKNIFTKNVFIDNSVFGLDNFYIGNISTMHKLSSIFFNEVDDVIKQFDNIINQEFLVDKINYAL